MPSEAWWWWTGRAIASCFARIADEQLRARVAPPTLERAARRAGLSKRRVREYLPYRMLEVEAAANAVYAWAAERVVERRFSDNRPDPSEYASAVRLEAQMLRHRAHEKLMRAFLEPEVFEGMVEMRAPLRTTPDATLLDQ